MRLTVDVRDGEVSAALRLLESDQLPFATMVAVNKTATDFQSAERMHILDVFETRRKAFATRSVKIRKGDFATKQKPEARVRIDSPGGRSDIFAKFEEGGTKLPSGRSIAIPDQARRTGTGVLRKGQRPKDFNFKLHGRGPDATVFRGDRGTFLIQRPDGTGGIFQRKKGRGSTRGRRLASTLATRRVRDLNVDTLYRFTPRATIDQRLEFVSIARRVVRLRFSDNFTAAFDRAIGLGAGRKNARRIALADVSGRDRVRV